MTKQCMAGNSFFNDQQKAFFTGYTGIFVLTCSFKVFGRNSTPDIVFGNHKPRTRGTVLSKSHSIFYLHGTGRVCKVLRFTVNVNT